MLPGSHKQIWRSHSSEHWLWAGQEEALQGLPMLQPVSTFTALVGRGKAGESGRTPKRTPCKDTKHTHTQNGILLYI